MQTAHHYFINGLEVSSQLQLPELVSSAENESSSQVTIRTAKLPDTLSGEPVNRYGDYSSQQGFLMKIPGVANYLISNGNEILFDPLPESSEKEVRLFLLGSAFGILLHQRGILPLHASAINVNGSCVVFVGESGAGKSTLAAFLNGSGYEVICDDVCALTINEQGRPVIWPGVPRIKLWSDALEALGHDSNSLVQDSYQENKFHLPLNMTNSTPLELSCIYELKEINNHKRCKISKLVGQEKMQALVNNIYRNELVLSDEIRKKIFWQCAKVLNKVGVFSFSRSKKFLSMDDSLSELKKHWTENAITSSMCDGSVCA